MRLPEYQKLDDLRSCNPYAGVQGIIGGYVRINVYGDPASYGIIFFRMFLLHGAVIRHMIRRMPCFSVVFSPEYSYSNCAA